MNQIIILLSIISVVFMYFLMYVRIVQRVGEEE